MRERDEWPEDPSFDWPSRFSNGDVVRLADGRLAVVAWVMDYASDPPPSKWELLVTALGSWGGPDDLIAEPWVCRPAPDEKDEARRLGLLP